mgnify:CR=1 FL=1
MNEFLQDSMFAGVTISLIAYLIGVMLKKKFKSGIFNPLLISIVVSIAILAIGKVDYETYNEGAKYLSWLLTPATVCLAIPLYEQWSLLKKHYKAVMLGLAAGTVTSLIITGVFGNIFGELICKIFRITEPVSKGLAFGASSHAIGTAKAIEIGEIEGAMSSLAIAVSGVLTVVLASLYTHFL